MLLYFLIDLHTYMFMFLSFSRWADQCTVKHDENRLTANFSTFPFVGQNIAWKSQKGQPFATNMLTQLIDDWYNEVKQNYFMRILQKLIFNFVC